MGERWRCDYRQRGTLNSNSKGLFVTGQSGKHLEIRNDAEVAKAKMPNKRCG